MNGVARATYLHVADTELMSLTRPTRSQPRSSYQDVHGPVPSGPAIDSDGLAQQITGLTTLDFDDLVMTSNIGPGVDLQFLCDAAHQRDERVAAGYAADGTVGGPYSRDDPPPGMQFAGYNKGATRIVWEQASSTESAHEPEPYIASPAVQTLASQRPEQVVAQIGAKFAAVRDRENASSRPWVNMGHESIDSVTLVLNHDGDYVTARQIFDRQLHYAGRDRLREASCGQPSPRVLELGAAEGSLLRAVWEHFHVPWASIIGVSATDCRRCGVAEGVSPDEIPDKSYRLLNIDHLHEHATALQCGGDQDDTIGTDIGSASLGGGGPAEHKEDGFRLIWSMATFYHLVDPIGTLETVYSMLRPGPMQSDGLAVICHLPLHLQLGEASAVPVEQMLQAWLQLLGHSVCIWPALDKGGAFSNFAVVRTIGAPPTLELPFEYTGDMIEVGGGADGYKYARMAWKSDVRSQCERLVCSAAASPLNPQGDSTSTSISALGRDPIGFFSTTLRLDIGTHPTPASQEAATQARDKRHCVVC